MYATGVRRASLLNDAPYTRGGHNVTMTVKSQEFSSMTKVPGCPGAYVYKAFKQQIEETMFSMPLTCINIHIGQQQCSKFWATVINWETTLCTAGHVT